MSGEKFYLVVDLEATCDDGGRFPRQEMEIIEIGAVLVEGRRLQPIAEFQTFVRPVRRPRLTPFCTKLTTITQAQVDKAPVFPVALTALEEFVDDRPALLCSWGRYDHGQFLQDARYHKLSSPLFKRHLDLKGAFSERAGGGRGLGLQAALRRAGLTFEGTHHRGIDDARNIARLLPYAVDQAELPREKDHKRERRGTDNPLFAWRR